jgi:hypothetical protein
VSTAVGVAPAEDKDPDDDIELPEDVAKEENLIAMGMTCADLLNGHSCRGKSSYCAASKLCQEVQVGGISRLVPLLGLGLMGESRHLGLPFLKLLRAGVLEDLSLRQNTSKSTCLKHCRFSHHRRPTIPNPPFRLLGRAVSCSPRLMGRENHSSCVCPHRY